MKSLIIAEKSSLAKNIASAVKYSGEDMETKKVEGGVIYESKSYVIASARGHLYTLLDIDDYLGEKKNWNEVPLPYFPDSFRWKKISDATNYIKIIKNQLDRNDISCVINGGDAGREGEYLIRLILLNLGNKKPVKRLWMPSQTPESIAEALKTMKYDSEYDGLYNEALARAISDWCYGINYTRFVTLKTDGKMLRVGRVISTIVNIIYGREKEIENFKPEIYYTVESESMVAGQVIKLDYGYDFEKEELEEAQVIANELNKTDGIVSDVQSVDKKIRCPKLFSLSKLQNFMSNQYSWAGEKTLKILENLYLNKYVTYPRTNTEFLPTSEKEKVERILGRFIQIGENVIAKPNDIIFDDSKIEDHGAIIPELNFPKKEDLSQDELLLYEAIKNRFLAYFCKESKIISETTITISFGDIADIDVIGHVLKEQGWGKYDSSLDIKDTMLPNLSVGDHIKPNFKCITKKTNPKKHYTVETLNNFLENPLKKIKGNNEEAEKEAYKNLLDGCNIGTPASLSGIIENAIKDQLIELKGKNYRILPKGRYLCDTLNKLKIEIGVNTTVELNKKLKLISENKMGVGEYVNLVQKDIYDTLNNSRGIDVDKFTNMTNDKILGKCPRCNDDVFEFQKVYKCKNENCKFVLFKNDKWWATKQKDLTPSLVKQFLKLKPVKVDGLYSEKKQAKYSCNVILEDDGYKTSFKFCFDENKSNQKNNLKDNNDIPISLKMIKKYKE